MELARKLKEREEVLNKIESITAILKDNEKVLKSLENDIFEEASNNMVNEIVVEDKKYKFSFKNQIFVKESVSDHSKKVELLKRLSEMGFDEAVFFESAYYPKVALKKVFDKLDPSMIIQFVEDGLIYHESKKSITERENKGN